MSDVLHPADGLGGLARRFGSRVVAADRMAEARVWAGLAVGSLGVAGAFALMLAVSRVPGIERIMAWPLGFFAKGLVIHVVFSLVVWFLAVLALLATLATAEVERGRAPRGAAIGHPGAMGDGVVETAIIQTGIIQAGVAQLGIGLVALAFPLLFLPAFRDDSVASLNNYVPVIIHPSYYTGLAVLAAGIACPVLRHLAAVAARLAADRNRSARGSVAPSLTPLAYAMTAAGVVYLTALACFAIAFLLASGTAVSPLFNEHLFWGGGHVMQFLNTTLLVTGWFLLTRATLGPDAIDAAVLRISVTLIAVFVLAAPVFYAVLPAFAPMQQEAFRRLQFVLGFPALIIALNGIVAINAARRKGALPWGDPGFLALVLSPIVFGAGGVMGLLISGSDTRTPAHYHGMITGVNLACMGLFLKIVLPRIAVAPTGRWLRAQILLFGCGQLAACVGLFWAGGYGAPRKLAAGQVRLLDGAVWGMYLNGIGALLAVIGGVIFVVTVVRALRAHDRLEEACGAPT